MERRGVGGGTSRRTPRRNQRGKLRRVVVGRSRGGKRGGGVRPGRVCGPTRKGPGPRASGGCGGRGTPARAVHNDSRGWGEPDPVRGPTSTTPLGRGSGAGGGVVVAGTLSGGRAGPPSSWSTRDGRGRHVTQRGGCLAVGGVPRLEGARPLIKVSRQRTSTLPTGGQFGRFLKSRTGPQTLEPTPPFWT